MLEQPAHMTDHNAYMYDSIYKQIATHLFFCPISVLHWSHDSKKKYLSFLAILPNHRQ